MKSALGILLAIAIVIIFLQNLCKRPVKPVMEDPTVQAMIKEKDSTIADLTKAHATDSIRMNNAAMATADQREKTEVAQNALSDAQRTINRLRAKVEGAKLEPRDSTWVSVSPHYVSGCDSLVKANGILNAKIDNHEDEVAKLVQLMNEEITLRDSVIDRERYNLNRALTNYDNCLTQLKQKTTPKQRNQVYAGIGLFGNQLNPIAGGQINFSLRTRGGQIYEITGATVGNVWYGGVGTKMVLTLRK